MTGVTLHTVILHGVVWRRSWPSSATSESMTGDSLVDDRQDPVSLDDRQYLVSLLGYASGHARVRLIVTFKAGHTAVYLRLNVFNEEPN